MGGSTSNILKFCGTDFIWQGEAGRGWARLGSAGLGGAGPGGARHGAAWRGNRNSNAFELEGVVMTGCGS